MDTDIASRGSAQRKNRRCVTLTANDGRSARSRRRPGRTIRSASSSSSASIAVPSVAMVENQASVRSPRRSTSGRIGDGGPAIGVSGSLSVFGAMASTSSTRASSAGSGAPAAASRLTRAHSAPARSGQLTIQGRNPSGWIVSFRIFGGPPPQWAAANASRSRNSASIRPAAAIGHQQVPMTVDDDSGKRLLLAQHEIERASDRLGLQPGQPFLAEHRREPGRRQHRIAVPQRQVQRAGEHQHHLAAGPGSAGFQKAEMALGDTGIQREVELAESATSAPLLQHGAVSGRGRGAIDGRDGLHGPILVGVRDLRHYLRGNGSLAGNPANRHDSAKTGLTNCRRHPQ